MRTSATQLKFFGSLVRTNRHRLGLSQEELADRAGLHRTYVADIERGARNPSLSSIDRLASALETSLSGLFASCEATEPGCSEDVVDILMVEDDARDVALTLRAFKKARLGNRIVVVRDGAEALDYLYEAKAQGSNDLLHRPRVILLDLNLPKVDGREVLRHIKGDERTRAIPVVVLTASAQHRDVERCTRLGADGYIVKPVDFERLCRITPSLNLSWMLMASRAGVRHDQ